MKSADMSNTLAADFPKSPAEWELLIAAAPGVERAMTSEETAQWNDAVLIRSGGIAAVRNAFSEKKRGQRGPQKAPRKESTTLRLPSETLARWKATGPGWQTRMAEVLTKAI